MSLRRMEASIAASWEKWSSRTRNFARNSTASFILPSISVSPSSWPRAAAEDPHAIAVVEAALIIEVGNHKNYDKMIVVTCPPALQRQRLQERSGLTPEQIETRIASQMPIEEKTKFADFVIDNSEDIGSTRQQVEDVYRQLRALA